MNKYVTNKSKLPQDGAQVFPYMGWLAIMWPSERVTLWASSSARLAIPEVVDRPCWNRVESAYWSGDFQKIFFLFDPSLTSSMSVVLMWGHCLRHRPYIKQHMSAGRVAHRKHLRHRPPHLTATCMRVELMVSQRRRQRAKTFFEKLMNIQYLNLPPYPNRWMVWLIQQGLVWRPRCVKKWNESGFRPPLCTYRLNWARRTSWGWWDDWDDTVLQTQDSKFEPWRSEAQHATSRSRRLPTILTFTRGWGRNNFVSFKPPRPGTEPRTLAWKAAVLTTTLGPPPRCVKTCCQEDASERVTW